MQTPATPANESERIHALQASHLLDSEYEAIFDNLTALVSRIFDVPIVAISLVDADRQWFKSIFGLFVKPAVMFLFVAMWLQITIH